MAAVSENGKIDYIFLAEVEFERELQLKFTFTFESIAFSGPFPFDTNLDMTNGILADGGRYEDQS